VDNASLSSQLDRFARLVRLFKMAPIPPSLGLMPTIAQQLEDRVRNLPIRPPTFLAKEKALLRWEAVQGNASIQLSPKDFRIICGLEAIVQSPAFGQYVTVQHLLLNPRALRALVACCHRLWPLNNTLLRICLTAEQAISQYTGKDKTLIQWQTDPSLVLGKQAPTQQALLYVSQSADQVLPLAQWWQMWGISCATPFVTAMAEAILADQQAMALVFKTDTAEHVLTQAMSYASQTARMRTMGNLLQRIATPEEHARLKRLVLSLPCLGDPRLFAAHWEGLPSEQLQRLLRWLSEADIRFFFDLLLKVDISNDGNTQKDQRKQFWLSYINQSPQFMGAWVVISRADQDKHRQALFLMAQSALSLNDGDNAINEGENHASYSQLTGKGNTRPISAFVLEFTRYVVVEFSAPGHATFFYEKQAYLQKLQVPSVYSKNPYPMEALKDPVYAIERLVHQGDWQNRFKATLARLGITVTML
jgi:hypothetical protein